MMERWAGTSSTPFRMKAYVNTALACVCAYVCERTLCMIVVVYCRGFI
uniref:Uncharacterized protein n=1 Tax=Anguilla anguilla TaxID=7936 RepID=A0A0E9PAC8_ANGAN